MQNSYESTQLLNYTGSGEFGQYNRYIGNLTNLNFSVMLGDIISRFKFHNDEKELISFKKYLGNWFYYKVEGCKVRTCLSKYQQNQTLNLLEKYQILISRKIGSSAKRHIRLNIFALNIFLLHPEQIIQYFDNNTDKEIKDFCEENCIKYSESVFNNSEFKTNNIDNKEVSIPSGQETLPLGEQETLPPDGQETLPPYIMNLNNEPYKESIEDDFSKKETLNTKQNTELEAKMEEAGLDSIAINFSKKYSNEKIEIALHKLKQYKPRKPSRYFMGLLKDDKLEKKESKEELADKNKAKAEEVLKKYIGRKFNGYTIQGDVLSQYFEIGVGGCCNGIKVFEYTDNNFNEKLDKYLESIDLLQQPTPQPPQSI